MGEGARALSGRAGVRYTGAWSVTVNVVVEPVDWGYAYIYVEAVDAQGRIRQLAYREVYLWYSRESVTVTWTGVLYNEDVQVRVTNDRSLNYLSVSWAVSPATLSLARENVTATQYTMYLETWTRRRYEGMVRIAANASANVQRYPEYKWRLTVVAVAPDRRERVLATTGWITGDKGTSASLTWTGALSDEWVKFVVENDQGSVKETLSAYVEPLLPANATVLYRWPVQLKAEFRRG